MRAQICDQMVGSLGRRYEPGCQPPAAPAAKARSVATWGFASSPRMLPAVPSATVLMLRAVALMIPHFGFGDVACA